MTASTSPDRSESTIHDTTRAPATMTPEERRREIAALLARGVLRLRRTPSSRPIRTPDKSAESSLDSLDEGAKTRLHVLTKPGDGHMKGTRL
jgi:hypothetical protein